LDHAATLRQYCASVDVVYQPLFKSRLQTIAALPSSRPLTLAHFYSIRLQALIHAKLQEQSFDLIFIYCSSMAQYVEHVSGIPRIIDFVDVDSEKWHQYAQHARFPLRLIYRLESRRLRRYEQKIIGLFDHGVLVSEKETVDFKRLVADAENLTPLLNGVDTDMFSPSEEAYEPTAIVFTGAMDYFANVDAVLYFAQHILPLIKQQIPEARLYVVGSNPDKRLIEFAESDPAVVVTGFVDAVQPYMHRAAVFVAPMRIARGVQNKILEAMATGLPVVTSSLGFEGIRAVPGRDLFVEDDPVRFADQVVRLLHDPGQRRTVGHAARETVVKQYSWASHLQRLEDLILKLTTV
jgi:sugar transferase (PEP-CTERM/EpsH1 system associated)